MLELMQSLGTPSDTSAGAVVNAARQAGATEVVDGTCMRVLVAASAGFPPSGPHDRSDR